MMNTRFTMKGIALVAMGSALLMLAACDSPPRGNTGGRVDPYRTTSAERADARPLPAVLLEFSDQVAEEIAADTARLAAGRPGGERVTVIVGDINNKTGNVSSTEFEMVRSRIRNQLLQSGHVRNNVKFVENRARMSRIAERERVAEGGFYADPPDYDPKKSLALNGDMYRIGRTGTQLYYFEFQLVDFSTNEIVFSDRIDLKQAR